MKNIADLLSTEIYCIINNIVYEYFTQYIARVLYSSMNWA